MKKKSTLRWQLTILPEWIHAPETQNPRDTEDFTTCCLPYEPLKEIAHPAPVSVPNRKATGAKKPPEVEMWRNEENAECQAAVVYREVSHRNSDRLANPR